MRRLRRCKSRSIASRVVNLKLRDQIRYLCTCLSKLLGKIENMIERERELLNNNKVLTPFWKAIEWICMMLFLARFNVSKRCRFQKIPSGTEVNELPERSRLFNEVVKLCSSSLLRSDMRLSKREWRWNDEKLKKCIRKYLIQENRPDLSGL